MQADKDKLCKEGVPVLEGRFWVRVTPDCLEAYLKSSEKLPVLSLEDQRLLLQELLRLGIVFGLLENPLYLSDRIVVARGKPPKPGQDAYLKFLVDMTRGPKEKNGRINFRELNTIVCVRAGQRIIQKVPPSPGIPGCNVFGEPIPPVPGKDITLKPGQGLKVSPDGQFLLAEIDGVLLKDGGKLKILPEFVLNSDVDWKVGNIHFCGKRLRINGAVRRGFLVEVKGNLEIRGPVENEVTIEVEGDLSVSGLIQGERTCLRCSGNVSLSIVENAILEVGGHLEIKEYLLNTNCLVVGHLKAATGTARIIGGRVRVGGSILVGSLGSSAQVKTLVQAGYKEKIWQSLEEVRSKMLLLRESFQKIEKILRTEKSLQSQGQMDDHKKSLLQKIKTAYARLHKEMESLKKEEQELLQRLEGLKGTVIQVLKEVYPGVEIWIADRRFLVVQPLARVLFYCKGGQILFRSQKNTSQ